MPSDSTLRRRFLLTPSAESRPSLLVELYPSIGPGALKETREKMLGIGCAHALVLDPERCVILRDTFASMDVSSIENAASLRTADLLANETGALDVRLEHWLNSLARNWHQALPHEPWIAVLLEDVVPAAAGAIVRNAPIAGAA